MKKFLSLLFIIFTFFFTACWNDDDTLGNNSDLSNPGQGIIEYSGYEPLKDRPVKVHFYIPTGGDMSKMPILFVFPGTGRNANDYLAAWINTAKQKHIMVFALEFPANLYSSSQYIEGGMYSKGSLLPETSWTFSMMEPLFDFIRNETGSEQYHYDMFGHSAGAQFVHRFMTFKPTNRVNRAVSANAGWYTVPDFTIEYPYGLKNSPATAQGISIFLKKKLILHLGTSDNNPDDSSLNHSAGADAQGMHRYARGLNYWKKAQDNSSGIHLNWQKVEETGVAHEFAKMATAAGKLLY